MRIHKEMRQLVCDSRGYLAELGIYRPLSHEVYPPFHHYPKHIVDYQIKQRERIKQEELDTLTRKLRVKENATPFLACTG